jgi:anti-sigma-K factor RskA
MPDNVPVDGPDEDSFEDLRSVAADLGPEDHDLLAPPPAVWAGILSQLDDVAQDEPWEPLPEQPGAGRRPVAGNADAPASPRRPHPRWRRPRVLVAAAVVVVVGLAAAVLVERDGGTGGRPLEVAALSNEGLAPVGRDTSGQATLVERDGSYYLDVDLDDAPTPTAGYLEVWLIDKDVQGMVSLGPYRGPGRYLVPAGVDPAAFPVVDVSDEPVDGLPTHSGVSVVRGVLA